MSQSVTVIGAGIAGLSCAFDLARAGLEVRAVDSRPTPGGVMGTLRLDDFQFETGPNSIPSTAAGFRALCRDVGIEDQLITSRPAALTRFLFSDGGLQALPMKPGALLTSRLLSWGSKLRLISESFRTWRPNPGEDDPDFESFLTERFGREIARTFGGSFVRGIYASEIDQLGTASAFPRLWSMMQEHGSVLRGLKNTRRAKAARGEDSGSPDLLSLSGGLGSLPDALARDLGDRLQLETSARSIEPMGAAWRVELEREESIVSDHVVLATPAHPTARLLKSAGMDDPGLATLAGVDHASVSVAHLGFERDFLPEGFGFLVPPDAASASEGNVPSALGILFVSKMFPGRSPAGSGAVSAIYSRDPLRGKEDREIVDLACEDLRMALPHESIQGPATSLVQHWDNAIPRYAPGHAERIGTLLDQTAAKLPGLHLVGSFTGGVSIDDRIRCGRECAQRLVLPVAKEGVA